MSATHSLAATAEMAVPFVRLDRDDPELLEELLGEVRAVAEQGAFTLGSYVEDFEADFAAYCEADEAVGVASGTDALAMSLRALGIGAGDEVIVPAQHVHRDRRGGQHGGRDAALRRRRPGHRPDHGRDRRARHQPARARGDAGAPLRRDGRHGPDPGGRPRGRDRRRRGRLPGARRPLSRTPRRARWATSAASASTRPRTWARGATAVRVVTNRPELADARAPAALARRAPALPPPRGRARPAVWTPSRPRSCASSCATSTTGTPSAGARRPSCAARCRARASRRRRRPGGRRRPRLSPVRRALRGPRPPARALAAQWHRVGRALPGARASHRGLRRSRLRARLAARGRGDGRAGVLAADVPGHRRRADHAIAAAVAAAPPDDSRHGGRSREEETS